jgi:hypothetical protein
MRICVPTSAVTPAFHQAYKPLMGEMVIHREIRLWSILTVNCLCRRFRSVVVFGLG